MRTIAKTYFLTVPRRYATLDEARADTAQYDVVDVFRTFTAARRAGRALAPGSRFSIMQRGRTIYEATVEVPNA